MFWLLLVQMWKNKRIIVCRNWFLRKLGGRWKCSRSPRPRRSEREVWEAFFTIMRHRYFFLKTRVQLKFRPTVTSILFWLVLVLALGCSWPLHRLFDKSDPCREQCGRTKLENHQQVLRGVQPWTPIWLVNCSSTGLGAVVEKVLAIIIDAVFSSLIVADLFLQVEWRCLGRHLLQHIPLPSQLAEHCKE